MMKMAKTTVLITVVALFCLSLTAGATQRFVLLEMHTNTG